MNTSKAARRLIRMPGVRDLEQHLLMDQHAGDKELREFRGRCSEKGPRWPFLVAG
jgi:hypothetical protein